MKIHFLSQGNFFPHQTQPADMLNSLIVGNGRQLQINELTSEKSVFWSNRAREGYLQGVCNLTHLSSSRVLQFTICVCNTRNRSNAANPTDSQLQFLAMVVTFPEFLSCKLQQFLSYQSVFGLAFRGCESLNFSAYENFVTSSIFSLFRNWNSSVVMCESRIVVSKRLWLWSTRFLRFISTLLNALQFTTLMCRLVQIRHWMAGEVSRNYP